MDEIDVTARFNQQGKVTPLEFHWQGRAYVVESSGRRWNAPDGLHILVMAAGSRVFELVFDLAQARWYLKTRPQTIQAA